MTKSVIIVAGGQGARMKSDIPKQFIELQEVPILMHSILAFFRYDKTVKIVVVLPKNQINFWKTLCEKHHFAVPHTVVEGGETRFFSVKKGLQTIDAELIAIHDGVRPLVSAQTIEECFQMAQKYGAAVPVMEIAESVRMVVNGENRAAERQNFRLVQTPQIFQKQLIENAYNQEYNEKFTDDASVVESAGGLIFLTQGNRENIKITTPIDLKIAETLLSV